jgi:hypothetical protein
METGTSQVDLSVERLFRKNHLDPPSDDGIPSDEGHFFTTASRITKWHTFARVEYTLEIKNYQIHEFLILISRCYRELCFVSSEMCLDDVTTMSACITRGRASIWDLPEDRRNFHWERAAKIGGVDDLHDAYKDDSVRRDAEDGMRTEGLAHWDTRVLRILRARNQRSS